MPNDCIPFMERADRIPGQATAAVTGKRFSDGDNQHVNMNTMH